MGLPATDRKPAQARVPDRFTGDAHGALLHPNGARGRVVLAQRAPRWRESPCDLADLEYRLRHLEGAPDAYFTQQRFWGRRRRIAQIAELGACYLDLDYRKTARFDGAPPGRVADAALAALDDAGLPDPWMIDTGRGVLLFWLFDPQPRAILPRWRAMQTALADALHGFGVDRGAMDAARVFRVAGSVNPAAAEDRQTVRLLHRPTTWRWDFEDFAREVLPVDRGELVSLRAARAKRKAAGNGVRPAKRLTAESLWEGRLSELQKLLHLRWWGALPPGERDQWLFVACVAMSWLSPPEVAQREFNAVASQVAGWSDRECRSRMCTVIERARQAYRGQLQEFEGKPVDPRYRISTKWIVDVLGITETEMRSGDFRSLVSPELRRENRTADERARWRRENPDALTREQYESRAEARRRRVRELSAEGWTQAAIAAELGIAERTVRDAVKRGKLRNPD